MKFNDHHTLEGLHATLGASKYHWVNYDDDHFVEVYKAQLAAQRGTELHELAERLIRMKIRLPRNHQTLNMHVNDAIGFKMQPEVILFYSPNAFGTADAISFDEHKKFLRVHDLKTGVHPCKFDQLYIYAALFCLEYGYAPGDITTEFRIYQNDETVIDDSDNTEVIAHIMDKIVHFDDMINAMRSEEAGWMR